MTFLLRRPLINSMGLLLILVAIEMLIFQTFPATEFSLGPLARGIFSGMAAVGLCMFSPRIYKTVDSITNRLLYTLLVGLLVTVNLMNLLLQIYDLFQGGIFYRLFAEGMNEVQSLMMLHYKIPMLSSVLIVGNIVAYWFLAARILSTENLGETPVALERVRELLARYNQNPSNYLILEAGTHYYVQEGLDGIIGYKTCNRTVFVIAEPVCPEHQLRAITVGFLDKCRKSGYGVCFSKITASRVQVFEACGFAVQEYGLEGILNAETFTLQGTAAAKIRWGINKTNKLGFRVQEYRPASERDAAIDERLVAICCEWFEKKNNIEMKFMLGELALDRPMDRRYFTIQNALGTIEAFITCLPYSGSTGYFIDVMRKSHDAPLGTMEKLIADAFKMLEAGGVRQLSLGLAPLAGVKAGPTLQSRMLTWGFAFIFEHARTFYGFKPLYQFKKKFNPRWETRYIAYFPPKLSIGLLLALVQVKSHENVWRVLLKNLRQLWISRMNRKKSNPADR